MGEREEFETENDCRIVYEVEVPVDGRLSFDGTPDTYRVVEPTDGANYSCMIYGKYRREEWIWIANVSTRWLVKHLLERLKPNDGE